MRIEIDHEEMRLEWGGCRCGFTSEANIAGSEKRFDVSGKGLPVALALKSAEPPAETPAARVGDESAA